MGDRAAGARPRSSDTPLPCQRPRPRTEALLHRTESRPMATSGRTLYPRDLPRISYAQNSEDILIDRLFRGEVGTFMDIGACHPLLDSNTWFFYSRGWRGVNFEP